MPASSPELWVRRGRSGPRCRVESRDCKPAPGHQSCVVPLPKERAQHGSRGPWQTFGRSKATFTCSIDTRCPPPGSQARTRRHRCVKLSAGRWGTHTRQQPQAVYKVLLPGHTPEKELTSGSRAYPGI